MYKRVPGQGGGWYWYPTRITVQLPGLLVMAAQWRQPQRVKKRSYSVCSEADAKK